MSCGRTDPLESITQRGFPPETVIDLCVSRINVDCESRRKTPTCDICARCVFCVFRPIDHLPERKMTSNEEEAKRIAEMGKPVLGEHAKLEVVIEESYEFKVGTVHVQTRP
ncbi:hypothetical protein F2P81_026208 [Scophthalmus maximus]|uniref:Uncharacterized protein n=1 Tax=Scophthalmus maximus TaxID=52904 RepID=A0A6A4RMM3_SCOMX|nr:hypothetical protein F2P81_026208 [Scophthalmus maximus]